MTTQFKNAIKRNIKCSRGNIDTVEYVTKSENSEINFEEYREFAVAQCEKYVLNETKKEVKKQIRKFVKLSGASMGYLKAKIGTELPNINFEDYRTYTNDLFAKKYANVKTAIRASVRYQ